jgi:hypothetical protein
MTDSTSSTGLHAKVESLRVDLHNLISGAKYSAVAAARRSAIAESLHDAVDNALDRLRYHLGG